MNNTNERTYVFEDELPKGDRHKGLFRAPRDRVKQPGSRDWHRADWCIYEASRLLKRAKELTDAATLPDQVEAAQKAAKPLRIEAVKHLAEYRMRRVAALKEGYQPRSKKGQEEALKVEAKMTPLERAQMHRRQKRWLNDLLAANFKKPKWVKAEPQTVEDDMLLIDQKYPGKKAP